MREFVVAAKRAEEKDVELLDIPFGEKTLYVKRPTSGQTSMFAVNGVERGTLIAAMRLLQTILVTDAKVIAEALQIEEKDLDPKTIGDIYYLRWLIEEDIISSGTIFGGDDNNPKGLIEAIVEEWAGRPTQPSDDSSESPAPTGQRSTGRSRSKRATTSSTSRSTDS